MPPVAVRNLELHVTHACNLRCENCSHYSNYAHRGHLSLEAADRQMGHWSGRIVPRLFSLLGGEPTLHPDLARFLDLTRRHWPAAIIQLVTNGWFLHRHGDALPEALERNQVRLEISVHHTGPEYREKTEAMQALVADWQRQRSLHVNWRESFGRWRRIYRGAGGRMQPFDDNDPRESWANCPARWCPQLVDGRIYKCPQIAYLPMQHEKFGLDEEWAPYLAYRPLEPGCSDDELREFLQREDESICGMCPAHPELFELPSPLPGARRVYQPATVAMS